MAAAAATPAAGAVGAPSSPSSSSSCRRPPLLRALPPAPPPELLFPQLVASIRAGGGYISSKLDRASVPPINSPGLVARKLLADLEQIVRVPAALQLSYALVQERAPQLIEAIRDKDLGSKVRIEGPEVVAFIAQHMAHLEARGWCSGSGSVPADASWLDLFIGMQLGADFGHMPHVFLTGDERGRDLFLPSPEVHNADWYHSAFTEAHAAIAPAAAPPRLRPSRAAGAAAAAAADDAAGGDGGGAGPAPPRLELTRFVQAFLILLTRTFSCQTAHRFVPVADMMNHASAPNAAWTFDEHGDFIVKTIRPIGPGEEVLISYGRDKSNVRLFRTYAFTLPPAEEPCCSFRVWPSQAAEIYSEFLPEPARRKTLDLETCRVDNTVKAAFAACTSHGVEPALFLRSLCLHFRGRYEADPLLAPLLARLARRRAQPSEASSADWWTPLAYAGSRGASQEEGAPALDEATTPGAASSAADDDATRGASTVGEEDRPWLRECALRVKMSEYMCLVAHLEALDLEAGARPPEQCISMARALHAQLSKAFEEARPAPAPAAPARPPPRPSAGGGADSAA